jgi:3,4-dihydroxy 2-butanone 4-phosphate synthase/GTP cyclohydrolase II
VTDVRTAGTARAGAAADAAEATGASSIETALEHLRQGRPVIVADAESREDEGDVVLSAELATPEWLAWTVRVSSGFVCAPMAAEIADRLDLPPMVAHNEDARGTAYTVSVDASAGVTTGISASDRATTLRVLADPGSVRDDLRRPGHVLPLRARPGGVRERDGHTEAAVDLMRAAGLRPVAAISEIVADDGEMMRWPGLVALGDRDGVPVVSIAQLVVWLDARDAVSAETVGDAEIPTSTSTDPTTTEPAGTTTTGTTARGETA